ncbi:DUF433 domain-containing protein [Chloroflexi bacterium TSY]|nr:DUF433 domain-containing protein [Chloroflexi bacterium TSY]
MINSSIQYIEERDQGLWILGTRVALDSVVFAFRDGLSAETIAAECFPTLTLEQVYGAIAYYLRHRAEIDAYLESEAVEDVAFQQSTRQADPDFARKLAEARRQLQTPVS